jgi:hypothetical protein
VLAEVAFQVALLHAAISTGSTSAHPVAGIASPRAPVIEDELDRLTDHDSRIIQALALCVHLGQLLHVGVHPAIPSVLENHI